MQGSWNIGPESSEVSGKEEIEKWSKLKRFSLATVEIGLIVTSMTFL